MTVAEAKILRRELEKQISTLIVGFEKSTQMTVYEVNLTHQTFEHFREPVLVNVKIEVNL